MTKATVAVVIPAYNCADCLAATLQSVLEQTHPPDEIIVVDDGSQDETAAVAKAFPVTLIQQPNQGAGAARNRAVSSAKSQWIAFLDADDLWEPGRIAALHRAITRSPGAVLIANDEFEGPPGGPWQHKPLHEHFNPDSNGFQQLFRSCFLSTSAVAVLRHQYLKVGGMDPTLGSAQDYDLWLKLAAAGTMTFIPEALSYYVVRPGTITSKVSLRFHCMQQILRRNRPRVSLSLYLKRFLILYYEVLTMYLHQRRHAEGIKFLLKLPVDFTKQCSLAIFARKEGS